jgi:hypothetical protein
VRRTAGRLRWLPGGLALVPLLSGCQSTPEPVAISPSSSLLAVDVLFPTPLGRDPSLVQVFLVRGAIHLGTQEIPELIPASFVKNSRAYLLDPEPGTYSLVAVAAAVAAPLSDHPVAGGVARTTLSGTIADAMIFPVELIHRTRTAVGRGDVAFMGALRVAAGERIKAGAVFQDALQRRLAERIRPGASSSSGLAGWFTLAWMVDLEKTSLDNEAADRAAFLDVALGDLGVSPWAQVVARAAPAEPTPTTASAPATKAGVPSPAKTRSRTRYRIEEPREPQPRPPESAVPARPERRRVPGIPAESPLAEIEIGMDFQEVRRILGEPDDRLDRTTSRAWIPFYAGPGAYLRDWIYEGRGRVVFSRHGGSLEVVDVVYDPAQRK